jgi:hypothetical protein
MAGVSGTRGRTVGRAGSGGTDWRSLDECHAVGELTKKVVNDTFTTSVGVFQNARDRVHSGRHAQASDLIASRPAPRTAGARASE